MQRSRFIRTEDDGPLTWIVLDRPASANSFSAEMLDQFSGELERLRTEGGPVIAIRGEGKGFSAGFDVGQVGTPKAVDPVADRARLRRNIERWLAIWEHPKPVITAVHGYCLAGATQLCVYSDITIVTENAKIGEPALPIGGGYIAPLWATLVGPKRAKELTFVPGNNIDGRTAVEWGWANHCVPDDELLRCVRALADRIAVIPADVLAVKKASVNRALEAMGHRSASDAVSEMDALLHLSPSVTALREEIARSGLKATMAGYAGATSTQIFAPGAGDATP
jgi:enoyl-CoA hydratase